MSHFSGLKSERLTYERLTLRHATPKYLSWLNDPYNRQFLVSGFGKDQTMQDLEAFIRGLTDDEWPFAILYQGEHIGNIRVQAIEHPHRRTWIGYMIGDRNHQGKGFASEAVARMTAFCFEDLKLHKVHAGCFTTNEASIRVLKKNGYEQEAHYKDHYIAEGKFISTLVFSRFNPAEK